MPVPLPEPAAPRADPAAAWPAAWREAAARDLCVHCGGPLGAGWQAADGPFCCRGCRAVHDLIHGAGLARYYDLRRGQQAPPATLREDSLAWLDRLLAELPPPAAPGAPLRLTLDLQGVHCAACVWLLEELFRREPGGLDLRINPSLGRVDIAWDPARGDLRRYLAGVEKFGYRFGPPLKRQDPASRALLARLAVCVAIALNVMMYSVSIYLGLAPAEGPLYDFFGRLSLALATISVGVGGQVFFRGAWQALRRGVAHLDLPIALGMLLAWAGSVAAWRDGGPGGAYFDSLCAFVALMLVGRWGQERILERNRNALLASDGVAGLTAKVRRDGRLVAVPAAGVAAGDELWIAPGDLVPVAGVVLRQEAQVALDWITGESDPRHAAPGETVPAGAWNAGGRGFALAAAEGFAASRLHELLRLPAGGAAAAARPRWWSRVSTAYVTAVLLLAAAAWLLWAGRDARRALEVTVAVLVVTCPCALGLAAPLAQELTLHALRRRGVFVRGAAFLDKALGVRKVILDKTGTLTLGRLVPDDASRRALGRLAPLERARLRALAARSNHPVSRGLAAALAALPEPVPAPAEAATLAAAAREAEREAEAARETPGQGIECRFAGRLYRLGRPEYALAGALAGGDAGPGATGADRATLFATDGVALARVTLREDFRPDAAAELAALAAAGHELWLLSGDAPARVAAAAAALGVPAERALGGLSPEEKAARVRALDRHDTLMVGDGLNDSPAFAAAWCAGTPAVDRPVLPARADFYFLGDGLAALRRALDGARRLRRVTRDNLVAAAAYNLAVVTLALAGGVTPVVAAVAMPLSSIAIVSWTAWRLSGRRLSWTS